MSAPVAMQVARPVTSVTAASGTASPISSWLYPGRPILDDLVLDELFDGSLWLAANRPAYRRSTCWHGSAQHHLLCSSRLTRTEIDTFP